jgi:hypothetical protein
MPDSLEYVVRPYQTPGAHGSLIIPSRPTATRERATMTWGAPGTMPEVTEVDSEGIGFEVVCCNEQLNERDRTSETKRIFQRGDTSSENWVDVQRPKTLRLKKRDKNTCIGNSGISFAAIEVSAALAEFSSAIHSGTASPRAKHCSVEWKFKNIEQTSASS